MEEHGHITSYDSFEEMQADLAERSRAAFAALTPHQKELLDGRAFTWFRYYPEFGHGFTIWGRRKSLDDIAREYEAKAKEYEDRGDPEGAAEWRDSIVSDRASLADGYVFGEAFSEVEPTGELGSTHAASMIGVPAEWFALAQMHHWSLIEMAQSGVEGATAAALIIDAWNTNLLVQQEIVTKKEE